MTFTDDDLKQFYEAADEVEGDWTRPWIGASKLKALLGCLKAAEKVIKRSALWHDGDCITTNGGFVNQCDCGSYALEEAWRKARGKGEIG